VMIHLLSNVIEGPLLIFGIVYVEGFVILLERIMVVTQHKSVVAKMTLFLDTHVFRVSETYDAGLIHLFP